MCGLVCAGEGLESQANEKMKAKANRSGGREKRESETGSLKKRIQPTRPGR